MMGDSEYYVEKPMGYSYFPHELAPVPVAWVGTTGRMVFSRSHDKVSLSEMTHNLVSSLWNIDRWRVEAEWMTRAMLTLGIGRTFCCARGAGVVVGGY